MKSNDSRRGEDGRHRRSGPLCIGVTIAILALAVGCTSSQGFNRAAMTEVLQAPSISDGGLRAPSDHNSTPSSPFRLGVFFASHDFPNRQSLRKVEWLSADREQLLRGLTPLQDQGILADIFELMDSTVQAGDTDEIRKTGARYGADAVLIVNGAGAIDRYNNRYAWLYPTVLGAYLAPGTVSDALVIATGSLWAVRSDWYVPIQTVEGVSKVAGSAVFVEDSAALEGAKKQAIQALSKRMVDQLHRLMRTSLSSLSQLRRVKAHEQS